MSVAGEEARAIASVIEEWQTADDGSMKDCFIALYSCVSALQNTDVSFVARPGVSYSLRPKHQNQKSRALFAMIDIIDDNPEERWLSVCFYGDMITDPEERGEVIPGGLAGSDGYCFDIYDADSTVTAYLKERLMEACQNAARGQ